MIKVGDVCVYVMEFDSDVSYSPNVGPAVVTKVHSNGNADLAVLAQNGIFFKANVPEGTPTTRMAWYKN